MDFGFSAPNQGLFANPTALTAIAKKGEQLGFRFVAVSDHIVIPNEIVSRYPYSETGEFTDMSGDCLDQLTMLSFLAGQTNTLKLVTSVMVLPHRNPVLAAKMLVTIDILSQGRLIVGCGVGWMREEFEAIAAPSYDRRGLVADEYISALKELWTSPNPSFHGQFVSFSDIKFGPKPIQKPHPQIWVGGESTPAIRRAARSGDGWYPIGTNPKHPMRTIGQFRSRIDILRRYAEEAGRDSSHIEIGYSVPWVNQALGKGTTNRTIFTGAPEQVAQDIRDLEDIGVSHIRVGFKGNTTEGLMRDMESFTELVVPLVND